MAAAYTVAVQALIDEFGKLPGIGPKGAQRIAFHLLNVPVRDCQALADSIVTAKATVQWCQRCFNFAESPSCRVCDDPRRDQTVMLVVEEARDLVAIEKTGDFNGVYHVLGGAISPMDGIGPNEIRVKELLTRLGSEGTVEVILGTNPNLEGEATAMYLARTLVPLGLKVTKIASGLPVGGDLEHADELTLSRALEGRRDV